MKICTKCREEKPLSEFYASARHRDGRQSWCKACTKANNRSRRDPEGRITVEQRAKWAAIAAAAAEGRDAWPA